MLEVLRASVLAAAICALGIGQPAAQEAQPAYTDVDLDQCTLIEADDFGSRWACPGHKGIPVMIAEGDLRFFVSYGLRSTEEKAAEQTLPPFNRLGEKIEWRISNASGQWKPFATILRYYTQRESGEEENQVLVVTRIEEGATCHVAYIDAKANADANELAREAADEKAPGFDCADEPEIIGEFEAW